MRGDGQCVYCEEGWYGEHSCDTACPENCYGAYGVVNCNRVTGDCAYCMSGYWGLKCENSCMTECANDCDRVTGDCRSGVPPCPYPYRYANSSTTCDWCPDQTNTYTITGLETECFCKEDWAYGSVECACRNTTYDDGTRCTACPANMLKYTDTTCACTAGYYAEFTTFDGATSTCALCDPGHFCTGAMSPATPCVAGTYANSSGLSACVACEEGAIAPLAGASACEPCGAGQQGNPEDATSCVPCPVDTYKVLIDSSGCAACPANGVCAGGDAVPVADVGFWDDLSSPEFLFFECENREVCLGNNQCAYGRVSESFVCSQCAKGYYDLLNECRPCPDEPMIWLIFCIVVGVVATVVVAVLFDKLPGDGSVSSFVVQLQTLSLFARFRVVFPDAIRRALGFLSFFYVEIDVAAPECAIDNVDFTKKWYAVVAPVTIVVVLALLSTRCCVRSPTIVIRARRLVWQLFKFVFLPFSFRVFVVFSCADQPDGRQTLRASPDNLCFESTHLGMFFFALFSTFMMLGWIVFVFANIRAKWEPVRHKKRKEMNAGGVEFGFFWRDYHAPPEFAQQEVDAESALERTEAASPRSHKSSKRSADLCYLNSTRRRYARYCDLASLLRRVALACIAAFGSTGEAQLYSTIVLLVLYGTAFVIFAPYKYALVSAAESANIFFDVVFLAVSVVGANSSDDFTSTWTIVGLACIGLSCAMSLFALAARTTQSIRRRVRRRRHRRRGARKEKEAAMESSRTAPSIVTPLDSSSDGSSASRCDQRRSRRQSARLSLRSPLHSPRRVAGVTHEATAHGVPYMNDPGDRKSRLLRIEHAANWAPSSQASACPTCGQTMPLGDFFCATCGAQRSHYY